MAHLNETLKAFNDYINGGEPRVLNDYLKCYHHNGFLLRNHCNVLVNNDEIIESIKIILNDLSIPPTAWAAYFDPPLTVSQFLVELHREGYIQIEYIIKSLHKKKSDAIWYYILSTLFIIDLTFALSTNSILNSFFGFLYGLFTSPLGFPVVGIVFSLAVGAISIYNVLHDQSMSKKVQSREIAFLAAYTALNLLGYSLLILAKGYMTPFVATVFIAASLVDVIKEAIALTQAYLRYHSHISKIDRGELYHLRNKYSFIKHRNAAFINLAAALCMLAIMTVWCVLPTSLTVSIIAIVLMGVLYGLKHVLNKLNENNTRKKLQIEIKNKHSDLEFYNKRVHQDLINNTIAQLAEPHQNELKKQFIVHYKMTLQVKGPHLFSTIHKEPFNYEHASLADIFVHGLLENGTRTKQVLTNLKWIDDNGGILLSDETYLMEQPLLRDRQYSF